MSDVATVKVELSDEQMDVLLRDIGDLIGKFDALERRIAKLENDQMLTMQTSPKKMPLPVAISYLEGMAHVAQRRVRELDALEQRIEVFERRLNHISSNIGGESIKIDGESSKNGGGE